MNRRYPPQPTYWVCYFCGHHNVRMTRQKCWECGSPRANGC